MQDKCPSAKRLLAWIKSQQGQKIISGQHTQTRVMEDVIYIYDVTGKYPALCGFELLSYSRNIKKEGASQACLLEIEENQDTLEKAYEWAKKGGIVTLTWHWFSPLYGEDKSFYTEHTTFDPEQVFLEGTPENKAFIEDMRAMADILLDFKKAHIPILWRPFHESEGTWFWWGSKGPEVAKGLYKMMYDLYTKEYDMDHLIWVWNSPLKEGYVGDDYCDILSRDVYVEAYDYLPLEKEWRELVDISKQKPYALAEVGVLPDIEAMFDQKILWSWFMTWSNEFGRTDAYTEKDYLRKVYHDSRVVTLEDLQEIGIYDG